MADPRFLNFFTRLLTIEGVYSGVSPVEDRRNSIVGEFCGGYGTQGALEQDTRTLFLQGA